jgi:hypothetical protein
MITSLARGKWRESADFLTSEIVFSVALLLICRYHVDKVASIGRNSL